MSFFNNWFEGNLEIRINAAKQKAEDVYYGKGKTLEEEVTRLQFILAREYQIPLFDAYFLNKTIDDLVFEIEIIKLSKQGSGARVADIMKSEKNKEELSSLFDDWDKPATKQSKAATKPLPKAPMAPQPPVGVKDVVKDEWTDIPGDKAQDDMIQFLKTGKFVGE